VPRLRTRAAAVAALYGAFAGLWIYLSDLALAFFVDDPVVLLRLSVVKGIAFVVVTSVLLWFLMRRAFGAIERGYVSLKAEQEQRLAGDEERRLAEERAWRERLFSDTIVESLPGILYLYDEHGRFLRWNRSFVDATGYSAEELGRMHPLDLFSEAERPLLEARIRGVFERGEGHVEASLVAKDGTSTPYLFTGRRVVFERQVCLVGMGIEIGERLRAEAALRELNESLERKVSDRTEELQTALVAARAADRTKSAFLATMSHELRTPLNSIIGFTGIILQGLAGPLNPEQARQLGMVRSSARHLLELINDVLDISRIEAGELELHGEAVDLLALVEKAAATIRPMAEAKNLTLTVAVPPTLPPVVSDGRRVHQILLNLLNNAVKFTDQGGVAVTVEAATMSGPAELSGTTQPAVRIRVTDTGIGIRPEDLATLFQPFHQIDSGLTRLHEGTGLGLAICRRLAGLLGGVVGAESALGVGSTFTVTLPVDRAADAAGVSRRQ
jgi:PAS domain S-box-containing protein